MGDAVGAVERALLGQVEAAGAGRQDLADPVGGDGEEGDVGVDGHPLAPPAGEVGDEDVFAEMELRLDGEVPSFGPDSTEATGQMEFRAGDGRPGEGVDVQVAPGDLRDQVRRGVDDVLIGRAAGT